MPIRRGVVNKFTPTRGVITEASKGDFPPDAAVDAANVEFLIDGTVQRRLGFDSEQTTYAPLLPALSKDDKELNVMSYYRWENVGILRRDTFIAIQYGSRLIVRRESVPLSDADTVVNVDLNTYRVSGITTDPGLEYCEFAGDSSILIITNRYIEPVVIYVDKINSSTEATTFFIQSTALEIRAPELLGEYTGITTGSNNLLDPQEFDLRNSGWAFYANCLNDSAGASVTQQDPVQNFVINHVSGHYPSPSVLYHRNKASMSQSEEGVGAFSVWEVYNSTSGLLEPPLGKMRMSAFSLDTRAIMLANASGTGGNVLTGTTTTESIDDRPISVAIHNGHVFYGGKIYNGQTALMVSQLIDATVKGVGQNSFERCMQEADPTDPEINSIVDTDGILLRPAGTGEYQKLIEFDRGVIIFTDNKVSYLTGQQEATGFSPTSFKIVPISDVPLTGKKSVVNAEDNLFYFTDRGIQVISRGERGGLQVQNITDNTIKSLYDGFSRIGFEHVHGEYVPAERRIYWTVPGAGNGQGNVNNRQQANTILIYSFDVNGFFYYTTNTDLGGFEPRFVFPMRLSSIETFVQQEALTTVADEPIYMNDGITPVSIEVNVQEEGSKVAGFMTVRREDQTVSSDYVFDVVRATEGTLFSDWLYLANTNTIPNFGILYDSYVEFGYIYPENRTGNIGATYLHSYFLKERPQDVVVNTITYPA